MIAVLGTGLLGSGMVEHALGRGESVRVWNRTASKTAALVAKGAVAAATPAEAVAGCERVHLVLAEDDAVDAVIAELRPGLGNDVLVLDHSTNLPARVAERTPRLHADGIAYVHAPVFMSPNDGRKGTGFIVVGGDPALAERARPFLAKMTGLVLDGGPTASGAATLKLCGNALFIGLGGVMGDVLAIGTAGGLTNEQTLGLLEHLKVSPHFTASRVLAAGTKPASFALTMARKDVRLMLTTTGGEGLVLPAVARAMDDKIAAGHGNTDYAVFAKP
jgi:3-hydroxyisobutyrate dehydrogenase